MSEVNAGEFLAKPHKLATAGREQFDLESENVGLLAQTEQGLSVLHRFSVFSEDFNHHARGFRLNFVHHLHCLNDADDGVWSDLLSNGHERGCVRRRSRIKGADHGRGNLARGVGFGGGGGGNSRRCTGRQRVRRILHELRLLSLGKLRLGLHPSFEGNFEAFLLEREF